MENQDIDLLGQTVGNMPYKIGIVDKDGKVTNQFVAKASTNRIDIPAQLISDTGWVPVSLINGWTGKVSVRLQDGVIYHNGYLDPKGVTNAGAFKYPDSFGDMTILDNFGRWHSNWVGQSGGTLVYGDVSGAEREFFCPPEGGRTGVVITLSHIVFKL